MAEPLLLDAFRECRRELLGFLTKRLQCQAIAADLMQDLYLRLVKMHSDQVITNSRSYLFRMAENLATDYVRVESRRRELLAHSMNHDNEESASDPEESAIAMEQLLRYQHTLAKMPALSREIFIANRFEGKSQRQIALEKGVSTTTVENHIRRVFDRLRATRDKNS